jgi:2-oxoglutarate ferredoxin oxidoreductase subunit delta
MRFSIRIDEDRCKGCALCVAACFRSILEMGKRLNANGYHVPKVVRPEDCTGCQNCAVMCPDAAVEIRLREASHGAAHSTGEVEPCRRAS